MGLNVKSRWFKKEGGDKKDEEALSLASQTCQEDEEFKTEALNKAGLGQLQLPSDRESLDKAIEEAINKEKVWEEKGQRGLRKFGRGVQSFATTFQAFVKNYAGFIDLVREAGGPYGEAAYSTLSLLFMVAIQKDKMDRKFAENLAKLQSWFPRVNLAQHIYPQPSIEVRVSAVYREGILFAREATKYFIGNTWDRLATSVTEPALNRIDQAVERLGNCLAEVNAEIGILLHQRVQEIKVETKEIKSQNEQLSAQNNDLLDRVQGLQQQNQELSQKLTGMEKREAKERSERDTENLEEMFRALGSISQEQTDLQSCRAALKDAFPEAFAPAESPLGWTGKYVQMTAELSRSTTHYQSWRESPSSCLLILAGMTMEEGQSYKSTLSWLSPAALHMVDTLSTEDKRVIFYCCHTGFHLQNPHTRSIVSNVLYRLIALQPELVRHRIQDLKAKVHSTEWNSSNDNTATRYCFDVLSEILENFPKGSEIYIVLDRIDLCKDPKYRFIAALQRVISKSRIALKVALVMDRISQDNDRSHCRELLTSEAKCVTFGDIDWDQVRKYY